MSELTRTASPATRPGEQRLVETLRKRYERELRNEASLAQPFELRLQDRTSHSIGEGGEPAFTITIGFFRGVEWAIERWTGAQPQRDDHEWLRRHGRRVTARRGQRGPEREAEPEGAR